MGLRKVTLLGSNLASVTDLKRIETPHSLCCDLGGYKTFTTRWSGGTVQVWVQVQAPAGHLAIFLKAVPEGNRRFWGQNQLPSSWGSSQALLVQIRLTSTNTGQAQTDWQAQTRQDSDGVSESAAVAAGSNRLAWGKHATTLSENLNFFPSQHWQHSPTAGLAHGQRL